jgi:hypothetical protein
MVYVIEYKNREPIAQYALSGVSAGLAFIEEQETSYPARRYQISYKKLNLPKTKSPSIKFP